MASVSDPLTDLRYGDILEDGLDGEKVMVISVTKQVIETITVGAPRSDGDSLFDVSHVWIAHRGIVHLIPDLHYTPERYWPLGKPR